eukprot:709852-Ditylum_brightwellii.AAC.1
MTGIIPSEIGRLKKLTELKLKNNNFRGSIPTEIGLMTSLTNIDLRGNTLEGQIPSEIGSLTNLQEIRLEWNWNFKCLTSVNIFLFVLLSLLRPTVPDDAVSGSIPKDIKTLQPCCLCNGQRYHMVSPEADKEIYRENGTFEIDSFNCAMLLEQKQDPDQLISANA